MTYRGLFQKNSCTNCTNSKRFLYSFVLKLKMIYFERELVFYFSYILIAVLPRVGTVITAIVLDDSYIYIEKA